ncbi:hypothetical protein ACOME3_001397 [Neoechinorhynchus agilis]
MSTWKKISESTRRKHFERGQHADRLHLGMLEKHPDYKLRADDYNRKRRTLYRLRQKALNRNSDEFFFGMIRTRNRNGIHNLKDRVMNFTRDELKLIGNSDRKYVDFRLQLEKRKLEKLTCAANAVEAANKIIRFFDNEEEAKTAAEMNIEPLVKFNPRRQNSEIDKRRRRVESLTKVANALQQPDIYAQILTEAS